MSETSNKVSFTERSKHRSVFKPVTFTNRANLIRQDHVSGLMRLDQQATSVLSLDLVPNMVES